jgi:hypothetical protein
LTSLIQAKRNLWKAGRLDTTYSSRAISTERKNGGAFLTSVPTLLTTCASISLTAAIQSLFDEIMSSLATEPAVSKKSKAKKTDLGTVLEHPPACKSKR